MNNLLENFIAAGQALQILTPVFLFISLVAIFLSSLYKIFNKNKIIDSFIIFLVFSLFGGTIGIFIGASKSPIVTNILPPVITLVSGYLILIGSKEFPNSIKNLLPGAVLLLLLSLLFSAFYMKSWYQI